MLHAVKLLQLRLQVNRAAGRISNQRKPLTRSLEEQCKKFKVCVSYAAQGALLVGVALPGGVVVIRHDCLAVSCIWVHWLQHHACHLSLAAKVLC